MLRRFAFALSLVLMPLAASAFDIEAMNAKERAAFNQAVREYLLANPEVIFEAVEVARARDAEAQAQADRDLVQNAQAEIAAIDDVYIGGNPEGDILFVEFLDYNCGYCRRFNPVANAMLAENDDIRHVVLEFPLQGDPSIFAAHFAIALRNLHGNAMYKAFHDTVMALDATTDQASLTRIASGLGLEVEPILAGMDDPAIEAELQRNFALASALQVQGTPSWILGDDLGRGYVPLPELQRVLAANRGDG